EAVNVVFVERRIHFIENAERTRAHHVDSKQQRDGRHCAFTAAQERDALQLFPRRLGDDLDATVERIVLIQQRQIRAPAAAQLGKHFTEIHPNLLKRVGKQFSCSGINARDDVKQLASRIREIRVLRFEKFVTLLKFVVLVDSIQIYRTHIVELCSKIGDQLLQ